ncbi:MAG: hypothetical protein ACMUEM_01940 [Flavobacteriales bacterium AspAUS03]
MTTNEALHYIIQYHDKIAVFFSTQNEESCQIIKDLTEKKQLEKKESTTLVWLIV